MVIMALSPSTKKYIRKKPVVRLVAPRRILASTTGLDDSPRIPFWAGMAVLALVLVVFFGILWGWSVTHPEIHLHANFLMAINGTPKDFSLSEFQSPVNCGTEVEYRAGPQVHLHNNNGGAIHVHSPNVTYGDFFASEMLGMQLSEHCFTDETGAQWCDQANGNKWQFFVNGVAVSNLSNLVVQDLDRVLLLYGYYTPKQLEYWQDQIPTDACQFSGKCPITDPLANVECST